MMPTIKPLVLFATISTLSTYGVHARIGAATNRALGEDSLNEYAVYVANVCDNNDVTIMIGSESNVFSANSCVPLENNFLYKNIVPYSEMGWGAIYQSINCSSMRSSTPIPKICPITGDNHLPTNFCIIETTVCGPPPSPAPTPIITKCTKFCNKGKPCGNSCITMDDICSIQTRGTACWAQEKCTKFCSKGQACGNACISSSNTCHKLPEDGFACNNDDYPHITD